MTDPLIRDITDTARWVAVYRARESERPDAVFRDPYARRLAGSRGEEIAQAQAFAEENQWPFIARTYLFDHFIEQEVRAGADLIVNLAAGLDARPYRMDLPSSLQWVEVDLPAILAYKEEALASEKPKCRLERVPLDLSDDVKRRLLFDRLGASAKRALVISEGLLVYLTEEDSDGARPRPRGHRVDGPLARGSRRAGGAQTDERADGEAGGGSRLVVPVRPGGRPGVLRAQWLETDPRPLGVPSRCRSESAARPDEGVCRDARSAAAVEAADPVVGGLPAREDVVAHQRIGSLMTNLLRFPIRTEKLTKRFSGFHPARSNAAIDETLSRQIRAYSL